MVKSGDIILFSGNGFISRLIRFATKSKYSHIGCIYINSTGKALVYDSTSLREPSGVTLSSYKKVLNKYNGKVFIRPTSRKLSELQVALYRKNISKNLGKKYEESKWELFLSAFGRFINIRIGKPTGTRFCSELVRNLYYDLGFILHKKACTPADFSEGRDKYLELNHIYLGQERQVK